MVSSIITGLKIPFLVEHWALRSPLCETGVTDGMVFETLVAVEVTMKICYS